MIRTTSSPRSCAADCALLRKVYEDDKTLTFLDIMPRASGHVVLPKVAGAQHSRCGAR